MDQRFVKFYEEELHHLQEMGAEFAREFPKVAARLGMRGLEVADPYVERLLEGVAFMAARVQLKLDAQFPRFTQALLEIVYPHYLAPTPAMLVARLQPDTADPSLASGTRKVPRGTLLTSVVGPDAATACEFQTAHDVTLLPLEVTSASYFSFAPDLPLNTLPIARRIKGGLRIRLRTTAGVKVEQLNADRLCFYLAGVDDVSNDLLELCLGTGLGVLVRGLESDGAESTLLPAESIRPVGFTDDEALLPVTVRSFQGYRLIQEYFSFPQRFRFVELTGLEPAIRRIRGGELELVILFGRGVARLEGLVDRSHLELFCTPAVNLFQKPRLDRIPVNDSTHEFHVVPDRTRPLDYEVYEVTDLVGHAAGDDSEQRFLPFYASSSSDRERPSAYFTVRRAPRLVPQESERRGFRSSYIGTELFISLVDAEQAPYSSQLRQLSLRALCTNRDLALLMPFGLADNDFSLNIAAPVTSIRVLSGPSRPYSALADGAISWKAISHLSLNYLSLVNASPEQGATALRELLELYATTDENIRPQVMRQIDGIRAVDVARVVRRLPWKGQPSFGRALEISVEVDELRFAGGSAFLFGAVLHQYFTRYASINSMTETVMRSLSRGEIHRWRPTWGTRPTL
jgi:type VI secretion system protein ImpG